MARTVTLTQLRADARLFADQRVHTSQSSTFINDTELDRLINLKLAELHELFVSARGNDYDGTVSETTIQIIPGTARYSLPADFFQVLSAELLWSPTEHERLRSLSSHPVADELKPLLWDRGSEKGYRVRGPQIEVYPTPTTSVSLAIQYAPVFLDLASPSDAYDGVNGWEKLVAIGVALEMREIAGTKLGSLPDLYAQQLKRITDMVADRQAVDPLEIRDVEPKGRPRWGFWLG